LKDVSSIVCLALGGVGGGGGGINGGGGGGVGCGGGNGGGGGGGGGGGSGGSSRHRLSGGRGGGGGGGLAVLTKQVGFEEPDDFHDSDDDTPRTKALGDSQRKMALKELSAVTAGMGLGGAEKEAKKKSEPKPLPPQYANDTVLQPTERWGGAR
jgi:hypothetical protein